MQAWFRRSAALILLLAAPAAVEDAREVIAEVERVAARPLWPGFEPAKVPAAIFDGTRTFLVRHPSPPAGFASSSDRREIHVFEGRHPLVTSNASAEIGGVTTATAILDRAAASRDPRRAAALIVHEAFHVWAAGRHPDWTSNEMDLFTYPAEDAEGAELAILEARALFSAAEGSSTPRVRCSASAAVKLREERFARMPESARTYERGLELKEGLAAYVQGRALGRPAGARTNRALTAVRDRVYATGEAIALILDQLDSDWKETHKPGQAMPLDAILREAAGSSDVGGACAPTPGEKKEARAIAEKQIAAFRAQRARDERLFFEAPGWRIEVIAGSALLWPQGFDPLNVRPLGGAQVLHTRWLKAGNEHGAVEVVNRNALTKGAGEHPILEGIRRLVVTGLDEPSVEEGEGVLRVRAAGVTAELRGARFEREGRTIRLRLP